MRWRCSQHQRVSTFVHVQFGFEQAWSKAPQGAADEAGQRHDQKHGDPGCVVQASTGSRTTALAAMRQRRELAFAACSTASCGRPGCTPRTQRRIGVALVGCRRRTPGRQKPPWPCEDRSQADLPPTTARTIPPSTSANTSAPSGHERSQHSAARLRYEARPGRGTAPAPCAWRDCVRHRHVALPTLRLSGTLVAPSWSVPSFISPIDRLCIARVASDLSAICPS